MLELIIVKNKSNFMQICDLKDLNLNLEPIKDKNISVELKTIAYD